MCRLNTPCPAPPAPGAQKQNSMETQTATLHTPYLGYTRIELIEKEGYQWRATLIGSGKEIMVYEDEFERD